jgi:hypothetical protein
MGIQLKNNAVSIIPLAISSTDTSFAIRTSDGGLFPTLGTGDYFYATISGVTGAYEIVKVTARVDNVFTVVRAQDGSIAIPFPANSRIELRVSVANVRDILDELDLLLL